VGTVRREGQAQLLSSMCEKASQEAQRVRRRTGTGAVSGKEDTAVSPLRGE
jgi:hypothetical protein